MQQGKEYVAETYDELQGLAEIKKATEHYPTGKCSTWSLTKAILQATEIAIQNVNELFKRIITDINNDALSPASIKFGWVMDLNSLMIKIWGLRARTIQNTWPQSVSNKVKTDSLHVLKTNLQQFDASLSEFLKRNSIDLSQTLEQDNLTGLVYRFLHNYKIIAHEVRLWDRDLHLYTIPADTTYEQFIGLDHITQAINHPSIEGDTFLRQFRCLHQIPEILIAEANDLIELAIISLRSKDNFTVCSSLKAANALVAIAVEAFKPIVNNLSHNDYHQIRKHLGLTSGSHSVNIHFHLFRDLYPCVAETYTSTYFTDAASYMQFVANNSLIKLIECELFELRSLLNQWRDMHLHLPRINLGDKKTKSLIGSSEAVEAARKMQSAAQARDPLNGIANLYNPIASTGFTSELTKYIKSDNSFDTILGEKLGKITKERFKEVQEREGPFAEPINFIPPKKREV